MELKAHSSVDVFLFSEMFLYRKITGNSFTAKVLKNILVQNMNYMCTSCLGLFVFLNLSIISQ